MSFGQTLLAQAQRIAGMHETARNYSEGLYKYYKEARLWWGVASFFTGAPKEHRGSAALTRL